MNVKSINVGKAFVCFAFVGMMYQSAAIDAVWTAGSKGSKEWNVIANWSDADGNALADLPTNAVDNVTFPFTDDWIQTIVSPRHDMFHLSTVVGGFFNIIAAPYPPSNGPKPMALTVDDVSGFKGRWSPRGVKAFMVFSGNVANPSVSAIDARKRYYVTVPENVNASLDLLYGGKGLLCKQGSGNLKIDNTLSGGAMQIAVEEGSVELSGSPADSPRWSSPAGTPVFWVSSDKGVETEEVDGRKFVSEWRDVRYADGVNTIKATPITFNSHISRPFISHKTLAGHPVIDFGAYQYTNDVSAADVEAYGAPAGLMYSLPGNIYECFIVWEDSYPNSNSFLLGQRYAYQFHKGSGSEAQCLFSGSAIPAVYDGLMFLDGHSATRWTKPAYGKFHLLNFTILEDGAKPDTFAVDRETVRNGGVRIVEVIMYTNRLTWTEKAHTTKYLAQKWKDPTLAISEKDLNVLRMNGNKQSVAVEEGSVATVGRVVAKTGVLNKKGDGVLSVGRFQPEDITINVDGGAVCFDSEVASACDFSAPAPGAVFWGDATKDSFVTTNAADGSTEYVVRWNDCRAGIDPLAVHYAAAKSNTGYAPVLIENGCNGMRVLDFGDLHRETAAWFEISCGNKIYETYEIISIKTDDNYQPNIIGGDGQGYIREMKNRILNLYHCYHSTLAGLWTIDGESRDPLDVTSFTPGKWFVASCAAEETDGANIIGGDRPSSTKGAGDIQLGEIICYDRHLTEEERRKTIAYLMNRWKNEKYVFARTASPIKEMNFTSENTDPVLIADADTVISSVTIAGAKTLRKEGSGDLTVEESLQNDLTDVEVTGGSLNFETPVTLFPDAFFHVDASAEETITFREGQEADKRIDKWYDCRNNGLYAATPMVEPGPNNVYGGLTNAIYATTSDDSEGISAGMPYVNFLNYVGGNNSTNIASGMLWYKADGTRNRAENVREFHLVFMMVKDASITGGGNLAPISGEKYTTYQGLVPKGATTGGFWDSCVNAAYASKRTDGSDWFKDNQFRIDGKSVVNKFYVMSLVSTGIISACSFALDRTHCGRGGVKLCEAIVFTETTNTVARSEQIHAHLLAKWKNIGDIMSVSTWNSLSVASGASLNIASRNNDFFNIKKISGGGTVNLGNINDVSEVDAFIDADGNVSCMTINGDVTFADSVAISISAADTDGIKEGTYPIFKADTLSNVDIQGWTKRFPEDPANTYTIISGDDAISLRISKAGTLLLVR